MSGDADQLRLVGLAQADPAEPTTGSGANAKYLLDALARRFDVVARSGVDLTHVQRAAIAASTFHPSRRRWRHRFQWSGPRAMEARSRNSARVLEAIDEPFDLVVQVYGLFQTRGAPYVLFIDNTVHLSRAHWPEWVEASARDLERLYDFERRLYGEAGHVFPLGRPVAESLTEFYGVPAERVTVTGGGATFDELPPPAAAGEREPVVLFVGADWHRKGGDLLLEAFAEVRRELADARLVIAGTTEPEQAPGVEVLGPVRGRDRVAELYRRARVFCLPSRFEPYGLVLLEAMSHSLPCVATRVSSFEEIVAEGETGLIVPPEDPGALAQALLRLLRDADYASRLGAAGRERVATELNWDRAVERMTPHLVTAASA